MDDISAINSDGIFEEAIPFIYPESLTLNKENDGNISANILDLTVELNVNSKNFCYKPYDKRDKFKFKVVNYPDIFSNISAKCCYGVVKSELKRYCKLSSKFSDFYKRQTKFFDKLLKKGYEKNKLDSILANIRFYD